MFWVTTQNFCNKNELIRNFQIWSWEWVALVAVSQASHKNTKFNPWLKNLICFLLIQQLWVTRILT